MGSDGVAVDKSVIQQKVNLKPRLQSHQYYDETQQFQDTEKKTDEGDEVVFLSTSAAYQFLMAKSWWSEEDDSSPLLCASSSSSPKSVSSSSYSSIVTLPEGMKEVYQNGILPYMMDNWFTDVGVDEEAKEQQQTSFKIGKGQYKQKEQEDTEWWNGYLPLEPAKTNVEDRSYRRRRPRNHGRNYYSIVYPQDLKPQDYVATSASSHRITLPTNYHNSDEWEIIFFQQQSDSRDVQTRKSNCAQAINNNINNKNHYAVGVGCCGGSSIVLTKSSQDLEQLISQYKDTKGRNSRHQGGNSAADWLLNQNLPKLYDVEATRRNELLRLKMKLCSVVFSFDDSIVTQDDSDQRGKDIKRKTLLELCRYMNTIPMEEKVQLLKNGSIVKDFINMVSANICRVLPHPPSRTATFTTTSIGAAATTPTDNDEESEVLVMLEPAWSHLQIVYELLLQFLNMIISLSSNADQDSKSILKVAMKHIPQQFIVQLLHLLTTSDDPRERDYLKIVLHRIYGKFVTYRAFIRNAISGVISNFLYEKDQDETPIKIQTTTSVAQYYQYNKSYNGIGELLEIFHSIIHGFALPLKEEHQQFLARVIIPLHKTKYYRHYHQQLSSCILKYIEKGAVVPILNGLFRYWPWCSSTKQVLFLSELEKILELVEFADPAKPNTKKFHFKKLDNENQNDRTKLLTLVFTNVARCLGSDHFQVVERTLFLWNNEKLINNKNGQSILLCKSNAEIILPIIYRPLYEHSIGCSTRNATIENLAQNVLKLYRENHRVVYEACTRTYHKEEEEKDMKLEVVESLWKSFEQTAAMQESAATQIS